MSLVETPAVSRVGDGLEGVLTLLYLEGNADEQRDLRDNLFRLLLELASNKHEWHAGASGLLLAADPILLDLRREQKEQLCLEFRDFLESEVASACIVCGLSILRLPSSSRLWRTYGSHLLDQSARPLWGRDAAYRSRGRCPARKQSRRGILGACSA